jgi:MSHA biogenesis protein MshQ
VNNVANCVMNFSDSGFVVTAPDHVSCNNASVMIEAVETAPGTGRCVPAYQNVTRAINLKCAYVSPTTGTLPVNAAGVALNSTNDASAACDGTGQSPTLSFDANGTATISLNYADAGQLTLTASDTAPTDKAMVGSGDFVVAPASFVFSGIPAAPLVAGQAFNATVTAMNACATPAMTPNFTGQTVTITSSNPQPGLGNATAIDATLTATSGTGSANLTWDEVGTIDLDANLPAYLGSALSISGAQAGVGRFHPAYFDTAVTPGCATFTYAGSTAPAKAGQPFTVTVTAKHLGGGVTANYAGVANAYLTTLSNAGVATGLANNTILAADFANGVGSANVTYAVAAPETAPLTLSMRATNEDPTPVSSSGHAEGTADIRSGRAKLGNAHGSELLALPIPFRTEYWDSGWISSSSDSCTGNDAAGGTASIALVAPGGWAAGVACVQDDGVAPGLSNSGCAAAGPVAQRFAEGSVAGFAGNFNLWLKAPGTNNTGAVTVTGSVPAWLQFAWGGGVVSNPTARATFGVYKGNNEFIYLRENY